MVTLPEIEARAILPAAWMTKVVYEERTGDLWFTVDGGEVQVWFHSHSNTLNGKTVEVSFESQEFLSERVDLTRAQGRQFQAEVARLRLGTFVYAVFAAVEWEGADLEGLFESLDDAREAVQAGIKAEEAKGWDRSWWIQISEVNKKVIG